MIKEIKPKVNFLSSCGHDLIYKCGKCNYGFNMAHIGYDYCPHCGNKIDWGVVLTVNEEWKSKYFSVDIKQQKEMLEKIDLLNSYITDGERREMEKTQATKNAILCSNIKYYLREGWTQEKLISKGFFTKEEFDIYNSENKV